MYIGCYKSGTKLSWHADICDYLWTHKLAPPGLHLGLGGVYLKSIAYRCGGWSVSYTASKYVMNYLRCRFSSLMSRDAQLRRSSADAYPTSNRIASKMFACK